MSAILQITHLSKAYGGFPALRDVSMTIEPGQIVALLGPNGAGKTTLIKLMMGMLRADGGQILVDSLDAFDDSVRVKSLVGYLPDEPAFYDYMRGRELIQFIGEMHGLNPSEIETRSSELARRLQLSDALDEFAENYSRGMKKKLGLICALLHQPALLILDEPTNGLDPHGTQVLHELMREHAASGRTVLFSTHLLDQAERLCDRVAVINRGEVAALGTLDDLRSQVGADASLEEAFFLLTESPDAVNSTATAAETTSCVSGEGVA